MEAHIYFFSEKISFDLTDPDSVRDWLKDLIHQNKRVIQELNFVFVSDDYLIQLNKKHLEHDYFTDILTFSYAENPILGDIYISIDRVKDNANKLGISFTDELHRVMAHGVLHILGYDDHEESDKKQMREQEEMALSLRTFLEK